MSEEAGSWQDRKAKTREAYFQRILKDPPTLTEAEAPTPPATLGSVLSQAAIEVASSVRDAGLPSASSVMSVMDTAPNATPKVSPGSSTPAASTSSSFAGSMVWMVSPVIFSERSLKSNIVDPSGSLLPGLPTNVLSSLQALATGRGEPIHEVVAQIADFFVEAEDERAEGTLLDAVIFYMEQFHGALV